MKYRSPSYYRKQGRESFDQYASAEEICPYNVETLMGESNRKNWLAGWNEAWCENRDAIIEEMGFE